MYSLLGWGDGAVTRERGERCVGVFFNKEPYFLPPIRRLGHGKMETGIDSVHRLDMDIHATKNRFLRARALREPDAKEMVPQIKVGGQSPCRPHRVTPNPCS
jgi:hypothetical protein